MRRMLQRPSLPIAISLGSMVDFAACAMSTKERVCEVSPSPGADSGFAPYQGNYAVFGVPRSSVRGLCDTVQAQARQGKP